ncbi:MAG: mandelate racemase/muconate lactonizing enzyme family protein [Alphaproteobacteria bacterium]|nr:mandelate racemase/muconate lactonizing enzyme family protein [Alphaproteobacteria bacterium]
MTDTITKIDSFLVPGDERPGAWCRRKPYVFVRVETSAGVVGWGEGHTLNFREHGLTALIAALAEQIIGTDAASMRSVAHRAFHGFGEQRAGMDVYCAASAIELALWDAYGKALGRPVYELLGGAVQSSLPVYANIFSNHPRSDTELAAKAVEHVEAGFGALKFYPFRAGETLQEGVDKTRAVRDAVGPEVQLAVDLWRHATPDRARELCVALEPFELVWIEDPFASINAAALRTLRDQVRQPLMVGETLARRWEFREMFEKQAVSLVNPDVCATGLVELRGIAAMAEPYFVTVSPHNYNSMALGTAITAHAAAGVANLGLCEYFPELADDLDDLCTERMVPETGKLTLPTAPGLGVAFDDGAMEQYRVS